MSEFTRKKNRFFLHHRDKGIPHLLLAVAAIRVLVLFVGMADQSSILVSKMLFSPMDIMKGEVWRLLTFVFIPDSSPWFVLFEILFYFYMDRTLDAKMGRLKLNLFFFGSVLMIDVVGLICSAVSPSIYSYMYYPALASPALDFCMFFALAAAVPNMQLLVMFILPVKVKFLAWIDLGLIVYYAIGIPFPTWLILLVPIVMLCLFFWKDIPDLLPEGFRFGASRVKHKVEREKAHREQKKPPVIHEVKKNYRHRCTVCGRTDVSDPDLEFRYCSRCSGYHCYCSDHINTHSHIIDSNG